MGHYLTVSAFRDVAACDLVDGITAYLREHGVTTSTSDVGRPPSPATIDVFEPLDGWTGVLWPEYFNLYDVAICRALSERLDTVVSAVGIAGNDGWSHHLLRAGTVLDRFASYPLALARHLGEVESVARAWAGDPATVAAVFGVPVADVATHFRQAGPEEADDVDAEVEEIPARGIRIWWPRRGQHADRHAPEDREDPADPWGFTRFWELVGITYPVRLPVVANLDLVDGWDRLLPRNPA
jgi:hypothetical protein